MAAPPQTSVASLRSLFSAQRTGTLAAARQRRLVYIFREREEPMRKPILILICSVQWPMNAARVQLFAPNPAGGSLGHVY